MKSLGWDINESILYFVTNVTTLSDLDGLKKIYHKNIDSIDPMIQYIIDIANNDFKKVQNNFERFLSFINYIPIENELLTRILKSKINLRLMIYCLRKMMHMKN